MWIAQALRTPLAQVIAQLRNRGCTAIRVSYQYLIDCPVNPGSLFSAVEPTTGQQVFDNRQYPFQCLNVTTYVPAMSETG